MTDVNRENTVGEGLGLTGDCNLVGDLERFDESDEEKFRNILEGIMLLKSGVESESEDVDEELELPDGLKVPLDDYLALCRLIGEEPHENLQTCAVCDAHVLRQCPWA